MGFSHKGLDWEDSNDVPATLLAALNPYPAVGKRFVVSILNGSKRTMFLAVVGNNGVSFYKAVMFTDVTDGEQV